MRTNKIFLIFIALLSGIIQISLLFLFLTVPSLVMSPLPSSASFNDNKTEINVVDKETTIYNGTTIGEAIKSNKEIQNKAKKLTENATSDRERAKILYTWVGSNIAYDDAKAEIVLNESKNTPMPESGAISAFNTRQGICFDKACLYVAMSKAIGLKVRLISGEAFDGEKYVGHAWNEIYLSDENTWINVDTTFYEGGDYFDSNLFLEHKIENIAGEW